ncbi:hypothetical protein GJR99_17300 [Haloferax sp. MBLA0078]|uniref:Uncharacterized protein n=2 Tax=Haloferacaceae TaxID=1644056 RepID=A0A6A8GC40_9EURY|nr:hypothetical protein Hfx1150_17290 [Haloferax sp. CBA1150]MRW98325.1 hypothetical protein [Haloferax marinum]
MPIESLDADSVLDDLSLDNDIQHPDDGAALPPDGTLGADSDIDVNISTPTGDIVETVLRIDDWYVVCSLFENRYAVTWEAPVGLHELLELDAVRTVDDALVEVAYETSSGASERRLQCTLAEAQEDGRFPETCLFLALGQDGYEVIWEREGTHTDGHELTVAVEGYGAEPYRSVFLRSLKDMLDTPEVAEVLGRLSESIDSDAPHADG